MAVAVKNPPAVGVSSPFDRLPVVSLVGAAYLAVCLEVVVTALPYVWFTVLGLTNSAMTALLAFLMIAGLTGLAILGVRLFGPNRPAGARAGVFVGFVGILIALGLARWVGLWLHYWIYTNGWLGNSESIGLGLTAGAAVVFLGVEAYLFFRPRTEGILVGIERQGWFHASSYKGQQGQRVRRGTILALLLIAGSGVLTMINNGTIRRLPDTLALGVPFTGTCPVVSVGDADAILTGKDAEGRPQYKSLLKDLPGPEKNRVQVVAGGKSDLRDGAVVSADDFRKALTAAVQNAAPKVGAEELKEQIEADKDAAQMEEQLENLWLQSPADAKPVDRLVDVIGKADITYLISRSLDAARPAVTGPGAPPPNVPTAILRLDPIVLRDLNQTLRDNYVLVAVPKDAAKTNWRDESGLQPVHGYVIPRQRYDDAVKGKNLSDLTKPLAEPPYAAASPGPIDFRLVLLPALQVTLPLLLIALALWAAWRLVNYPAFADFLIATEAELNKVSWITRKRLVQDTIVVLVTTLLLAVFLFAMDQTWRILLSNDWVGVLKFDNQRNDLSAENKKW